MQIPYTIQNTEAFKYLDSLDIDRDSFTIFGSMMMYILGLKEDFHDIDILALPKAWEQFMSLKEGVLMDTPSGKGHKISFLNNKIEVFDTWGLGEWNDEQLVDDSKTISGYRIVGLETVKAWKKKVRRNKDIEDIEKIDKYLV